MMGLRPPMVNLSHDSRPGWYSQDVAMLWMENILPVKMLGGLRPPRTPHYGPPAPDGKFDP